MADCFFVERVEGAAGIYDDDIEAAQAAAVRVALNTALERMVGVHIKSERVVEDGVMLSDIIHAHASGYARLVGHVKPPWREDDHMYVLINACVSKDIPDIVQKLSHPKGILISISETVIDRRSNQLVKPTLRNELQAQLQHLLATEDRGYKVWLLPQHDGQQIRRALQESGGGRVEDLLHPDAKWLVESIGIREFAEVFMIGDVSITLRDSDIQGAVAVDTVTQLQLLRVHPGINRVQAYTFPTLIERGIHRQADRAIQFAISDTIASIQTQMTQLEAWAGPPNRFVTVYVEGLPSLFVYEEIQDQLRRYATLGVERVNGVIFAPDVSKILITLSQQSLIHGNLPQQVEFLALALDEKRDYAVRRKDVRTILLRYVGTK